MPDISQYYQQNAFSMNDDPTNFNDHEYQNLGYLLVSSVYQMLTLQHYKSIFFKNRDFEFRLLYHFSMCQHLKVVCFQQRSFS